MLLTNIETLYKIVSMCRLHYYICTRIILLSLLITILFSLNSCKNDSDSHNDKQAYTIGEVLVTDDFSKSLSYWISEGNEPEIIDGQLVIDANTFSTIWLKPLLLGNVLIEFDVTIIANNGSESNPGYFGCFAMASDPANQTNFLAGINNRTENFSRYDNLNLYHIKFGCDENTSIELIKYNEGKQAIQVNLNKSKHNLSLNNKYHIQMLFLAYTIETNLNEQQLFSCKQEHLYTQGQFGFNLNSIKAAIDNFRVIHLRMPESS